MPVFHPFNFVYTRVCSIAKLLQNLKVFEASLPLILHLIALAEVATGFLFIGRARNVEPLSDELRCALLAVGVRVDVLDLLPTGSMGTLVS